ncbi:MFS transporter [Amnibacterium endophyticum]|uniref:MFS transporter n=1 Tax=Amnibacterium endophyticum TaxID=2109337 RepID=A0ABW4LFU8_9MICO
MSTESIDRVVDDRLRRRLLAAAILASFVSFLDGSITNIALPAIERDLGGGVSTQQWVVDGYLLTLSALILLAGAVSDAAGRLRVLRIAIVAFVVTSALCALAPTAGVLIGARVLQGVAGAFLVPGSLSLIIAVFEGPAQSKAIGTWTGWTTVSGLLGPVVGGGLVDGVGWRSVFLIGLLPAAAAMLLLGRTSDGARPADRQRIDVASAALAALGLAGVTVGLIELGAGAGAALPPAVAGVLLAAGGVALGGFLLRNARTRRPLVPPSLFAARNFAWGNLSTFFVYGALGLVMLVPTLFLQRVVGLPATGAALVSLPSTLLLILLSGRFGALAGRLGARRFMTAGPIVAAGGALTASFVRDPATALWFVIPSTVLIGLGLSMTVAPLTAAVLGAVPPESSGIGSAVNNAVARVAGLITVATAGWILGGVVTLEGYVRSSIVTAVLLAVGGLVALAGIRGRASDGA